MTAVASWHEQNPSQWGEFTPQEQEFRKLHSLSLDDDPLDWFFGQPKDLPQILFQDGNRLFVETDYETWSLPTIAEKIMEVLSGKARVQHNDTSSKNLGNKLLLRLSCSAPNEPLAQAVYDEVIARVRLETWGVSIDTPWFIQDGYGSGYVEDLGLHQEDHKLFFELVFHRPLRDFVPMLTYLKSKGFSEITYEFADLWELVHVEGNAPSEAKAKQIETEIQKCIENKQPLPWQVEFQHMVQENPQIEVLRQNEHLVINMVSKWLSEWDVIKSHLRKNGFNSKEIKWKTTPILEFDIAKILRGNTID